MSKILIVDDDPKMIKLLTLYLVPDGFDVITCSDGIKALELVLTTEFDLVLIDALLPKMDGFTLIRKIRESNIERQPAIILMTAVFKREKYKKEAIDAGADVVIYKPFKKADIMANINLLLYSKNNL